MAKLINQDVIGERNKRFLVAFQRAIPLDASAAELHTENRANAVARTFGQVVLNLAESVGVGAEELGNCSDMGVNHVPLSLPAVSRRIGLYLHPSRESGASTPLGAYSLRIVSERS